jgi:hypothetical protein
MGIQDDAGCESVESWNTLIPYTKCDKMERYLLSFRLGVQSLGRKVYFEEKLAFKIWPPFAAHHLGMPNHTP